LKRLQRGLASALADSALMCHVEHAMRNLFLHDSPVLLIVTYAEDDLCALYLVEYSAWSNFRELLSCSIRCLREHAALDASESISLSVVPAVLYDGFRLQFVLTGPELEHYGVQPNLPQWA